MRILIFICFFSSTVVWSHAKSENKVTEKKLSVCYISDPKRSDTHVIRVQEEIENMLILAHFDSDLDVINTCQSGQLGIYTKNSIKINNQEIAVSEKLGWTDITQYIPERLLYVKANDENFIVIEMYNFSDTSLGGGYYYIAVKLTDGKPVLHKIDTPCNKEPFRNIELVMKLLKQ